MLARSTRFATSVVAALLACGCSSESRYNIPADESKDFATIAAGAGAPQKSQPAGKKKVTKPPHAQFQPKDMKNVQSLK